MINWQEVKLGDICEITSSKRIFMADYVTSGIPFYRSKEIIEKQRGNNISTELFITEKKYEEIKQKFSVPQEGDILLTSVGTLGIPYIVRENEKFYFKDGNLTWIKKSESLLPEYLYYYLVSVEGKFKLENISIGTTQKAITIVGLKGLEIPLPPLDIQKKIAGVLGALDDKIELNNKINNNLEQQAQALFKSWFVDFEPFCGVMPEDWKIGKLKDVLKLKKTPIRAGENCALPYLPIDIIPIHSLALTEFRPNSEAQSSLITFDKDDILIGAMRVYFHRVTIAPCAGITRTTCFVLSPFDESYLLYALLLCNQDKSIEFAQTTSKGSTMPYAVWDGGLGDLEINIPQRNIVEKFNNILLPSIRQIQNSYFENTRLAAIRDALLPKLMSGEIDVSNVDISALTSTDKLSFTED